jgi:23S rRNA pseudouridine2605 synthase
MRINRFLAAAGFGSRRACEQLVLEGRVSINGKIVKNLATKVSPEDSVKVGSRMVKSEKPITIMMNKPKGILCSTKNEDGKKTVFDLLPKKFPRLFYVGRLDADTEGLLLLTNQGKLAQKLTHPKYKLPKEYEVVLDKPLDFSKVQKFLKGFKIQPGFAKFEKLHKLGPRKVKVILKQGLKRQIREMFYRQGYEVMHLRRVKVGGLELGNMRTGEWKFLSKKDLSLI